jgi:signal transduction histidine kinase
MEEQSSDSAVLTAVHRIATALFARPTLDEILPQALAAAMESVGAEAGTIYLHELRDDTLVFRHVVGGGGESLVGRKISSTRGIAGAVFQSGDPIVTSSASKDPRHVDLALNYLTESMVTVPLRNLGGRSVGVMQVLNKVGGGAFTRDHDLAILETLASLAATAIENAQQMERDRKAAVADAVGDIAHDIKNMMTPVESWAATLDMIAQDSISALDRLAQTVPPDAENDMKAVREFFEILPEGLDGIRDGSEQVKDRGAEIADALKGNVRAPCFVMEDIARTADRVCKTLKPSADQHGIVLSIEGRCAPFPHDRTHLFNALYNLVSNAIPHVPAGGSIRTVFGEDDGFACVHVIDNGEGMPEDVRSRLFTDKTISTTAGGTGLGTQIVARVAAAHGGTVTVKSEPGKGSDFCLRLPLARVS